MSRRAKWTVGGLFVAFSLIVALLPFSLMLVPNPHPILVGDLRSATPGTYIEAAGGTYRLFPFAEAPKTFPSDAPVTGARPSAFVRYKQLAEMSEYGMFVYPAGRPIAVKKTLRTGRILEIVPAEPLAEGTYYVRAGRESAFGGVDYFYFRVGSPGTRTDARR